MNRPTTRAHPPRAEILLGPQQGMQRAPAMERVCGRTATCRKQEAPCVY